MTNESSKKIRIKYLCKNVFAGGTPDTTNMQYWNGDIPWIASGALQNCDVNEPTSLITKKGLNESSTKMVKKNTALIAMTGATCANVGYSTIDACYNQSVCSFINKKNVSARYLYYALIAERKTILSNQFGGAQAGINVQECKNFYVTNQNKEKQEAISIFLDNKVLKIDETINRIESQIDELKKYKQNLVTEQVTKKMASDVSNSHIEWIGKIPNTWNIGVIKYDFTLHGRIGWQGLTTNDYKDEGPYLITGTDFSDSKVNWNTCVHITNKRFNEDSNIHVRENDLLITKDGTIGKLAIAKNCPEKVSLNSGIMMIKTKTKKCLTSYLYYVLMSDVFWNWYYFSQRGNATIKHLYQEQFEYFKYPLPSIEEQISIVDYLNKKVKTIDNLIEIKIKKKQEYLKLKESLIYECVNNKKEVN